VVLRLLVFGFEILLLEPCEDGVEKPDLTG